MLEVVDGEDGGDAAEGRVLERGVEINGEEAGGPVVAVDDVGNPVELLAEGEGAAREEGEAKVVVGVGTPWAGVDLGAGEEAVVLQQIHGDGGAGEGGFPGAGPVGFGADIDAERLGAGGAGTVGFDGTVGGADDTHIVAEGGEFLGEGAGHVGKASYFDKRFNLGCYEENF